MRRISKRKILVLAICAVIGGLVCTESTFALSKYTSNYNKCINESGGRGSIKSVQQACTYAANGHTKNGCSLWIGSASSNGIPIIYSKKASGTIPAAFWGMCTDYADTTRKITVKNDNGAINSGMNLTRGVWAAPRSVATTIDVAKFISGASVHTGDCYKEYTRTVIIGRSNGETGIYNEMPETISLRIASGNCLTGDLCKQWNSDYESSDSTTHSSGTTSIVVKARNAESRFGGVGSGAWSHGEDEIVYAKPGDNIKWQSCYYPGVQKTVSSKVSDIGGTIVNSETNSTYYDSLPDDKCLKNAVTVKYKTMRAGYNDLYDPNWQNQYRVGSGITSTAGYSGYLTFDIGSSKVRQSKGSRNMGSGHHSDVGNKLEQKAETGKPISVSISSSQPTQDVYEENCYCCGKDSGSTGGCDAAAHTAYVKANPGYKDPKDCKILKCTNKYSAAKKSATVDEGPTTDSAFVVVPYNFSNTTGVKVGGTLYSGEYSAKVTQVWVKVGKKYNYVTMADYATLVPDVKAKLFMYVSDSSDGGGGEMVSGSSDGCRAFESKQCKEMESKDVGELSGGEKHIVFENKTYNAFDASAGDYVCFVSAVWPASSGSDTNYTDASGDNMWAYSKPKCKVIYKKPTFQVWGGSMYSYGSLTSSDISTPQKKNIYATTYTVGDYGKPSSGFKVDGGSVMYFTPWVEQSLVLRSGHTKFVDSGAGSSSTKGRIGLICDDGAWLAFANNPCNDSGISGSNIPPGTNTSDRDSILRYWLGNELTNDNDQKGKKISKISKGAGKLVQNATAGTKIYHIYSSGNLRILNESKIGAGKTYLIKVKKRLTIDSNILYADDYSTIEEVPKVVIRAKDVYIKCGVTEIDAVIIADNEVKTCSDADADDLDTAKRARQLKIVGTVVANTFDLGRTYGAAASKNPEVSAGKNSGAKAPSSSGVAAEIFDYDPTIFMWQEFMAGSGETDAYETSYEHELSPRY